MNKKDIVQIFITVSIVMAYLYLVITKQANVEGFAMLALYVIKKFLDILEVNGKEPPKSTP